ncbi:MAG: restriction endonuclease subunit S [Brasilonema octagenarum HA4186-MV1]|jgi:type I restriction enzyme S subunit|nr:restriction endonuclease subunit S [Brasilonema octagenarum HA4186-MV1]
MVVNNLLLPKELHLAQAGLTDLPNDWSVVEVGELLSPDRGISVGVMYPGKHDPLGIPLLKVGDLTRSVINPNPEFRITPEKHYEYRRTALEGGEILLTLVGGLGQCAIVPPQMAGWNAARAIAVIRLKEPSDAKFVRLCFLSPPLQHLMQVWANTTVQATLNLKEIKQLPLPFPPPAEREAIAHILGTLDDKIELNREMNQTLEAIARAIFKSWFVDFDPVRAKMEGRQPAGMDAATAELFPSEFEESALGIIPKGWRVDSFDKIVHILSGGTPKTSVSEYWNGNILWFSVKDAPNKSDVFVIDTEKRITQLGVDKSAAQILPKGTTIITARGTVVKLALIGVEMAMNQSCFGIKGKNSYTDLFIYYHLSSVITELQHKTHGSVFDTINRQTFTSVKAVIPPKEIAQAFDKLVKPLMDKLLVNLFESRTLASIRDTLLPKLLSGEIRVKEAEKVIEALT